MKNTLLMVLLFGSMLLLDACGVNATKEPPPGVSANEPMAEALAQALVDRDFDLARIGFSSVMQSALSKEKLEEAWDKYSGNKGAFVDFGPTYVEYVESAPCVFIPCMFENGEVVVQVTQDAEGLHVTGFYLRPPGFSFL